MRRFHNVTPPATSASACRMPLSQRYTFFLLYDFSIGARGFHGYAGNEIRFFEKIEVRDDRGAGNAGKAREFRVVKFRARVRREHLHERIDTLQDRKSTRLNSSHSQI